MKKWYYISLLAIASLITRGQEVAMAIDQNPMGETQTVTLTVSINRMNGQLLLPDNLEEHFHVLSQIGTSRQQYITNNGISTTMEWTIRLRPKRKGNFTLNPAAVTIGDDNFISNSIDVKVIPDSERPKDPNSPEEIAKVLTFGEVEVSDRKVYVGEPLNIKYNLFGLVNPANEIDIRKKPEWDGFIRENIDIQPGRTQQTVTRNGRRYARWTLESFVLVPQRAGEFSFEPMEMIIPTPVANNRMMWGRQIVNNLDISPIPSITVLPLPEASKPESFDGAVGSFDLNVTLSRDSLKTNESVTLNIEVSGRGNINTVRLPQITLPSQIKIFGPTPHHTTQASSNGLRGEVNDEYVLVPHFAGTYKIPAIEFSYFDPNSEEYITLKSEELEFVVEGENNAVAVQNPETGSKDLSSGESSEKLDVEVLNKDIRWIHEADEHTAVRTGAFWKSVWFIGGVSSSFLLAAWVLFAGRISDWRKNRTDALSAARKEAIKSLSKTQSWKELHTALSEYLKKAYHIPYADQVRERLPKAMSEHGFSEETGTKVHQLLTECEAGQYGSPLRSMQDVQADITEWIKAPQS